jgi:hypothetical protein
MKSNFKSNRILNNEIGEKSQLKKEKKKESTWLAGQTRYASYETRIH